MKLTNFICLAAALVTAQVTIANAAPLPAPSGELFPLPSGPPISGGTLLFTTNVSFSSSTFNGSLTTSVFSGDVNNPNGGLTFTYSLVNSISSPDAIHRFTIDGFAGYLTDVSFQPALGAVVPYDANRNNAGGTTLGFDFGLQIPPFSQQFAPGDFTALLVVRTDSTSFTAGVGNVIDGSVATAATVVPFGSTVPVPEPTTFGCLLMGLGALFVYGRSKLS